MKKAISYGRFSTVEQRDGDSSDRQNTSARDYCSRIGLDLQEELLMFDEGLSAYKGEHLKKGALGVFRAAAKAGKFPDYALVIEQMDRLSRLPIVETFDLLREITDAGVEIHDISDGEILKAGFGNDLMQIMKFALKASGSTEYSKKLSQRVGSAWRSKKSNATDLKAITANVPAWLKAEQGKPIVPIPERAATVRKIFQLAALGLGGTRIIHQLIKDGDRPFAHGKKGNKWTLPYIGSILSNRAVLGEYQPGKYVNGKRILEGEAIPNFYPSIISYTEWNAARSVIDAKNIRGRIWKGGARGGGRQSMYNLFTGLIKDVIAGNRSMNYFAKAVSRPSPLLITAFSSTNRIVHRINYNNFEKAFLGFLDELDWKAVAGESESPEVKAAQAELESVLAELDHTEKMVTKLMAMTDDIDLVSPSLFAKLDAQQAKLIEYKVRKKKIAAGLANAREKAFALYSSEELRATILAKDNPELRMRLKAEIAKRVSRIDLSFNAEVITAGPVADITAGTDRVIAKIEFINGASRWIVFQDDKAVLLWLGENVPASF